MRRVVVTLWLGMSVGVAACSGGSTKPPVAAESSAAQSPTVAVKPRVSVKVLAINDLHGNLEAGGMLSIPDEKAPGQTRKVPAGGVEYLGTLVRQLRAKNPNSIFVSAGDLVGASPLLSSLFWDEPTIESMNKMDLALNVVGNHEFDKGRAELFRKQNGGCHPKDGCAFGSFDGAKFQFLGANVIDQQSGKTLFPPYVIREFDGLRVGFIGVTLEGVPSIVSPSGVEGLVFRKEADTVNALVPELQKQGVETIVVLMHEGGEQSGSYNECKGVSGAVVGIVERMNKAIDVVITGHTHQAYNCQIHGKLVTSANQYGRMLSEIDLEIDRGTRDLVRASAENLIVRNDLPKDVEQSAIIAKYKPRADEIGNRVVGQVAGVLSQQLSDAGESVIGSVVADAQLESTKDPKKGAAVIAFMNSGGIRGDVAPDASKNVSFRQLYTVQPFGGNLVTITLTGAQLKELLEQQFVGYTNAQPHDRILQVSTGFSYVWDKSKPAGSKVDAESMRLNGGKIDPKAQYRVTVNSFLMTGGDNFAVLKQGIQPLGGDLDVDVLSAYVKKNSPLAPPKLGRISRKN